MINKHKDIKDGFKWLRLSAVQGYDMAQYVVGIAYIKLSDNYETGVVWLEKAAEQNNSNAQYRLGKIYHNGVGVTKDLIKAHKWLNIAGNNCQHDAQNSRDNLEKEMTPSQIEKAHEMARNWKPTKK